MEERQLVLNSTIIEKYPNLKAILRKYEKVEEKDIDNNEDFDEELKNLILYVFKDIVNEAQKEWYGSGKIDVIDPPNSKDRIKCSLCGTPNIYINYIVNRYNKKS